VRRARRSERGSALVEALVAVLLFSIGIVALLRVLGASVKDAGDVEYRATAATIADETIGRMWVDRANLAAYSEDAGALGALPNGTRTVTVAGNVVTVTINWQPPGADAARTHTVSATLMSN
jgi:type IV pilus assembly protein PilV